MTEHSAEDGPRFCLILPTYNNAGAVGEVVTGALATGWPVVVVDDGCTDGTEEELAAAARAHAGLTVLTHPVNRGKGAAILTGLQYAEEAGFTHAITLDTDGQHAPEDVAGLIAVARADPRAIVVGVRQFPASRRGRKSRLLCVHSNFWVWVETGVWVADTQSGFRIYPVAAVRALRLGCVRYDFEIEVLVKALWTGVPVGAAAVRVFHPGISRSHFRPLVDFARVSWLNAGLTLRRMVLPGPVLAAAARRDIGERSPMRWMRLVLGAGMTEGGQTRRDIAASVALGVACGILPVWGFQMALAVLAAHVFKLNRPLALAASNISFPAAIPVIVLMSLALGQLLLTGSIHLHEHGDVAMSRDVGHYVVGAVALAAVAALVAGGLTYLVAWLATLARRRGQA